jgi:hypothetical protein
VSGGGGATPYVIYRSPDDFYNKPGPTYHYCTLRVEPGKLHFEMHKLNLVNGKPQFEVGDQFDLQAPRPAAQQTVASKPAPRPHAPR